MMTPQGLQIVSSGDQLARLGIITDNIVIVNIMFSFASPAADAFQYALGT
jgi:hypothetical protein